MLLEKYGLDEFFLSQLQNKKDINNLAKIISTLKKGFKIILENGSIADALIKGSIIHYKNANKSDLPKIGDFVLLESLEIDKEQNCFFIEAVLNRKNELKRKLAGEKIQEQVIVVNIDYVFINVPSDEQFNLRRVERMVVATIDANIVPIIVITKADIAKNIKHLEEEIQSNFNNIKILTTSMFDNTSVNPIKEMLKSNKIGTFIGNSGCGKSTLTNMMLGEEVQKTASVSALEDKGRHTTTHRELFLLPEGGSIIDNPGIKEFGLWLEEEDSLDNSFNDILEFANTCKFSNCTHQEEPDCSVQKALSEGKIDKDRFNNYLKLKKEEEAVFLSRNIHKKRARDKSFAKMVKEVKSFKKHKRKGL